MPSSSDDVYLDADSSLTVFARMLRGDDRRARVCLAGEIDMAASPLLSRTLDWVTAVTPASVLVDLAEVTFACSALPNFVVRLRRVLVNNAELVLWRPSPMTRWVLRTTDMASIVTVHDGPAEHGRRPRATVS